MRKIVVLAVVLGAFVASNAFATPYSVTCYGGYDPSETPTWWYLLDDNGMKLEDGDCVKVYTKGENGIRESPDLDDPPYHNPGGDDVQVFEGTISFGMFTLEVTTFQEGEGIPEPCDEIYAVIFEAPCDELFASNYYGVTVNQHHVEGGVFEYFYCKFPDDPHYGYTNVHVPVELMSFEAMARDGEVLLEWKTATETDNFGFHIERSLDAVTFQRITEKVILGAGNSETGNTYAYVDKGLVNGTTYSYNLVTVDLDGVEQVANGTPVAATPTAHMPTVFALHQNYPNPFNPWTDIKYDIPKDVHVTLKVYNVLGAEVATLVDADQKANFYTVRWDAKDLASGVYFCRLMAGDFCKTVKMVFLK